MKQKLIIGISILLLLGVIVLISLDLFNNTTKNQDNPDMYDLEKLKRIDTGRICYTQIRQFKTTLTNFSSIAVDDKMNVFTSSDRKVEVYDKNWKKTFEFTVDSELHCFALGGDYEFYLGINNHIEVFDKSGKKTASWNPYEDNSYLTSIVVIGNEIYAADAENAIILRYDKNGNLLNTIGKKNKAKGIDGFTIPSMYFDLATGADNELWVANTGRHLIQHFTPEGDLVSSWGTTSMQLEGFAGCCNPVHFAIMPDGDFVTYEKGLDRIKVYDQTGKFICAVAGPSNIDLKSLNTCSVNSPIHDLAVDKEGKIYALDGETMLVRVFTRK